MKPIAALDASLLAIETLEADQTAIINNILLLQSWLHDGKGRVYALVSERVTETLSANGYFPAVPYLKNILKKFSLSPVFSAPDIAELIASYLATTKSLEEEIQVSDILASKCIIQPDVVSRAVNSEIGELTLRTLMLIAIAQARRPSLRGLIGLCALPCPSDEIIRIKAIIDVIEPERPCEVLPARISELCLALGEPKTLFSKLDPFSLWVAAETASDLRLAIELAAEKLAEKEGTQVSPIRVGPNFFPSLHAHQAASTGRYSRVVFEKCARIAAGASNMKIRPLRVDARRQATPQTRAADDAIARRVHLTRSHEALRIMFWEIPDGTIEFSNVGVKSELYISETPPSAAV